MGLSTVVARVRQRYVNEGLEAALTHKAPEREYRRKLLEDGEQEARLIAWRVARAAHRARALDAQDAGG